jgi:hypothetical protein
LLGWWGDGYNARPSTSKATIFSIMFDDRRARGDRRKHHNPEAIPPGGCRRQRERRDFFRQYYALPWWLQTNYAEELQPPLLEQNGTGSRSETSPNTALQPVRSPRDPHRRQG